MIPVIKTVLSGDNAARHIRFALSRLAILDRQQSLGFKNDHDIISPFPGVVVECFSCLGKKEIRISTKPVSSLSSTNKQDQSSITIRKQQQASYAELYYFVNITSNVFQLDRIIVWNVQNPTVPSGADQVSATATLIYDVDMVRKEIYASPTGVTEDPEAIQQILENVKSIRDGKLENTVSDVYASTNTFEYNNRILPDNVCLNYFPVDEQSTYDLDEQTIVCSIVHGVRTYTEEKRVNPPTSEGMYYTNNPWVDIGCFVVSWKCNNYSQPSCGTTYSVYKSLIAPDAISIYTTNSILTAKKGSLFFQSPFGNLTYSEYMRDGHKPINNAVGLIDAGPYGDPVEFTHIYAHSYLTNDDLDCSFLPTEFDDWPADWPQPPPPQRDMTIGYKSISRSVIRRPKNGTSDTSITADTNVSVTMSKGRKPEIVTIDKNPSELCCFSLLTITEFRDEVLETLAEGELGHVVSTQRSGYGTECGCACYFAFPSKFNWIDYGGITQYWQPEGDIRNRITSIEDYLIEVLKEIQVMVDVFDLSPNPNVISNYATYTDGFYSKVTRGIIN